ncbi:hypothetical protein [Microbacterium sp.]|uniref:hypothetical protein n=1 Tax=Microbacterium sp. TaxID=51671 RepID=UPI0028121F8D|nr:hypothetical protein [Microbacterium sp.]
MNSNPTQTPNVVIENPKARKIAGAVLDVAGLTLAAVIAADAASPAFDVGAVTVPALAVWSVLRAGFGLGVTAPNVPR